MKNYTYVKDNYLSLLEEMNNLSIKLGTPVPTLVSVTKSGSDEELLALVEAGARDIGENRPGEVLRKGELLRNAGFCPRMHEIGTLQRNKIKLIAPTVHLIHSVDSLKLASDISRHALALERRIPILIEVNSAREEQKSGAMPEEVEGLLSEISSLPGIKPVGLMTMGPLSDSPESIRPYFRQTKALFDELTSKYDLGESPILSMGMSDSWRVAMEEGSTLIRVGRRLFIK